MPFAPSRDGLNVPSLDADYFGFPPLLSSIPCFSLLSRGRRQLPQAGEVRRPLGPAWRAGGLIYVNVSCGVETQRKRDRRGRGLIGPSSPAPPPPAPRSSPLGPNGGSEGTKRSVSCAPQHHLFFQRSHAGETPLFVLEILDSANSANGGSEGSLFVPWSRYGHHFRFFMLSCMRNCPFRL